MSDAEAMETCVQPMDCDPDEWNAIGTAAQCIGCSATVGLLHDWDCPEITEVVR